MRQKMHQLLGHRHPENQTLEANRISGHQESSVRLSQSYFSLFLHFPKLKVFFFLNQSIRISKNWLLSILIIVIYFTFSYSLQLGVASSLYSFPHSSVSKESACNTGDLGLIPGSGRSPGEGNGNPLQYSCLENPRTEEPHGLQLMGSHRVGHD